MYLAGVLGMGGTAIRTLQYGIRPALRSFREPTETDETTMNEGGNV